jgi:hypothetical protein
MQGEDQLAFAVLMARDELLVFHHLNTKREGRFMAAVRIVAIQAKSYHDFVRY